MYCSVQCAQEGGYMFQFLSATTNEAVNPAMSLAGTVIWMVALGLMMYFLLFRPQKKQQKKQEEIMASVASGDSILTTAGFYGVVIDVMDEVVIVEFGNNKNCRIPMQKRSIVEVEKPNKEESK